MRADKSFNYCYKPQRKQRLSMTLCQISYRSEFNKDKTSSIFPGHFLEFYGLRKRLEIMTKLSHIEGVSSTRNPKVSRRTTREFRAISGLNNPQISRDTRYLQSGFSHPIMGKITWKGVYFQVSKDTIPHNMVLSFKTCYFKATMEYI